MSQNRKRIPDRPGIEKDERGTPLDLFERLDALYHFTIDVAASPQNRLLPRYYTKEQDGLKHSWQGEVVWCNPPYSDIETWLRKALSEYATTVFLLPASTDVGWFHDLVVPFTKYEFLRGRLKFQNAGGGNAPFGSMIVVVRGDTPSKMEGMRDERPV